MRRGAGRFLSLDPAVLPAVQLSDVRMVLIEAGPALLPDLPAAMGRYTTRNLARRRVELVIGDGVTRIDEHGITLTSGS